MDDVIRHELDAISTIRSNSAAGTFDPVEAEAVLAALQNERAVDPRPDDAGLDAMVEHIRRETAYVDPVLPDDESGTGSA